MSEKHPYVGLPDRQFWKTEAGIEDGTRLDPVSGVAFEISRSDRIVTAGSCFAQHVAKFMSNAGFNHHITERAHPMFSPVLAGRHNYGMFAARYGNVYTARQLKQLLQRAYGAFVPQVKAWELAEGLEGSGGKVVDPFRPQIQPGGFVSEAELEADRAQHFACIRAAIEQMDVFVFTLGLTEGWQDPRDAAVFPIAPGVAGGVYDPQAVQFVNFDEAQTAADLVDAIGFIREVNPKVKVILTVSPVALNATYEDRHVLASTVWSKAVLRIAAEKVTQQFSDCVYFPSYEIITSPHVRGRYFAPDCREVTAEGVAHVMRLFVSHFTDAAVGAAEAKTPDAAQAQAARHDRDMQDSIETLCDEAAINNE